MRMTDRKKETVFIHDSSTAVRVLRTIFKKRDLLWVEHLYMLCLDNSNRLIGYYELSRGGRTASVMDLEVMKCIAAKVCAKKVILAHNHPSGMLTPSQEDITGTALAKGVLAGICVELVDHFILNTREHLSFNEKGLLLTIGAIGQMMPGVREPMGVYNAAMMVPALQFGVGIFCLPYLDSFSRVFGNQLSCIVWMARMYFAVTYN